MDKQPGAMGTSAGLALRLGQATFSVSSLLFMCFGVSFFSYSYAPFCFLVTTMGLVTPWSLGLAMIDTFLVLAKRPSNQRRVLSAVVLGDWRQYMPTISTLCCHGFLDLDFVIGVFALQSLASSYLILVVCISGPGPLLVVS
ncbi:hypothetical protein AABB24_003048 [Solanum stoloniferum]|uniref:CASP-like protein n=1 Tax=Solanum stoloniferum TaxID=62892 RepID=A0ABD2V5I7_9SOLN